MVIIEQGGASGIQQVEARNAVQNPAGPRTAPYNCWPVRGAAGAEGMSGEGRGDV